MDRSWSKPIRVVLADDHTILRQGLAMLLSVYPEIQVVGEACTGQEAIKAVEHLTPDVVVMDIAMPVIDGLQAYVPLLLFVTNPVPGSVTTV